MSNSLADKEKKWEANVERKGCEIPLLSTS